jgi:hypothetical protein
MTKRISSLKPGDNVLLKFHGSKQFGNDPYEMDVKFVEFNEDKTLTPQVANSKPTNLVIAGHMVPPPSG